MIPDGWKVTSLGDICSGQLQTGPFGSQLHAHEYVDEGTPVLMPKDLIGLKANIHSAAKISSEKAKLLSKHQLKVGDILFSRRGDVARFALIDNKSAGALCGTGCLKATPSDKHSPIFLSYFLQKNAVKRWLEQNAVGQTMPNMNTAILSELPLMAASSKNEEEKIAQILSTWDKAIETVEKLIENSQQKKKALMQQLLTGKKRFPGFDREWKEVWLFNAFIR
jgi:type I restriction enzyme S subunit